MPLRFLRESDYEAVCQLWEASIRTICGPAYGYDSTILAVWCENKTPEALHRIVTNSGCCARVVTDLADLPQGFSLRFGNDLRSLYVSPSAIGRGLGTALLVDVEWLARCEGHDSIVLGSSRNAVPFYEKHGYRRTDPGEKLLRGVIPYIPMTKAI